jgi:hypothetical protein
MVLAVLLCLAPLTGATGESGKGWTSEEGVSLGVHVRHTLLGGQQAFGEFEWRDLFKDGIGFSADLTWMSWLEGEMGFYVGLTVDSFEGKKTSDAVKDTIEPDRMMIIALPAGLRGRGTVTELWGWNLDIAAWLGVGPALYLEVEADAVIGGTKRSNLKLYERRLVPAGEIGLAVSLGPIEVGGGGRLLGAPKEGDDFNKRVNPEKILAGFVEIGLRLRF